MKRQLFWIKVTSSKRYSRGSTSIYIKLTETLLCLENLVTLSFQATKQKHERAQGPDVKQSNGATAGEFNPSTCPTSKQGNSATTILSTPTQRRIVVQQVPLPILSKLGESNCGESEKQNKYKTNYSGLGANCCIYPSEEALDIGEKHCDKNDIEKIDQSTKDSQGKGCEENSTKTKSFNTPYIDRMLLRPSAIQLPSLVTGASGKIQNLIANVHWEG